MLEFTGTFEMNRSREELWPYFTDPDVLAECAPGCKEMTVVSPHEVEAVGAVGVGSVKPEFDVDVLITETEYPAYLAMQATGYAPRNEFETTATMELVEDDSGTTTIAWTATADVSGTIASLGGRALRSVTNRLVGRFFSDLESQIENGVEAESQLEGHPDVSDDELSP